jgi:HEAT repeat protein
MERLMSKEQTLEVLSDIERALDHPDDRVRIQVVQLIAQHPERALRLKRPHRDVIDVLVERIEREPPSSVRVAMLTAITALGPDPRSVATMIREAQTSHGTYEHLLSLSFLSQHDPENARPFARRLLFSAQRDQVRIATHLLSEETDITPQERVRMLCVIPMRSSREWTPAHFQALLKELQGEFHSGARELILQHHPGLLADLASAWDSVDAETQRWLCDHASEFIDGTDGGQALIRALASGDRELVLAALRQVSRFGPERFEIGGHLLEPLFEAEDEIAALAIRAGASPEVLRQVALDQSRGPTVRAAAISAMARKDSDGLSPDEVRMLLEDPNWRLRSAAADLLALRSDLLAWLSEGWGTLSERARLAVARAALEQKQDDALEARFAEVAL